MATVRHFCNSDKNATTAKEALKWMLENQKYDDTVICSDSQSLLTSIDTLNPDTNDIRSMLDSLHGKTYFHWVPGHTNIPGNEYADRAAKEAAKLQELENNPVPVGY
jgi:ribonuclease HI